MWKKILIISQCLLILFTSCINVYATTEKQTILIEQETILEEKEYITPEEYFVRTFEKIYNNCYLKNKERDIQYYKEHHPITFEIIYQCILEPEQINYKKIKEILKTKLK